MKCCYTLTGLDTLRQFAILLIQGFGTLEPEFFNERVLEDWELAERHGPLKKIPPLE